MRKKLLMLLTATFLAFGVATVANTTTVVADDYTNLNYDQVIDFWSSQPAFQPIFAQEAPLSPYEWNVKTNVKSYFRASLTDYCIHPDNLNNRPYTKAYMQGVIANSNPYIYQQIVNNNYSFIIQEKLLEEMNCLAPYLSYQDKCQNVAILTSFLNSQGVYTVDQYENWKQQNGGQTAFEVYCHHVSDASDAWSQSIKDASKAQQDYNQAFAQAAYDEQQQINDQIADAYQQQQEALQNMFGGN